MHYSWVLGGCLVPADSFCFAYNSNKLEIYAFDTITAEIPIGPVSSSFFSLGQREEERRVLATVERSASRISVIRPGVSGPADSREYSFPDDRAYSWFELLYISDVRSLELELSTLFLTALRYFAHFLRLNPIFAILKNISSLNKKSRLNFMSKTLLKQREFFLSAEMSAGLKYKNSRIEVELMMDRDNDVGTSYCS